MTSAARRLGDEAYIAVTTFRRDGTPVPTPVWVALGLILSASGAPADPEPAMCWAGTDPAPAVLVLAGIVLWARW